MNDVEPAAPLLDESSGVRFDIDFQKDHSRIFFEYFGFTVFAEMVHTGCVRPVQRLGSNYQ